MERGAMNLDDLKWDARGLVTVVVQDAATGEIRMVAHANREAVELTISTGEAHFYSRSRGAQWKKGESSGHTIRVDEIVADCDGDALLYLGEARGPSCHTLEETCFFEPLAPEIAEGAPRMPALPILGQLERELLSRKSASGEKSYTRHLLDRGAAKIGEKIREEAGELADALEAESDERVASEFADLFYHALVGLIHRGIPLRAVIAELGRRFGRSGLEEKASRSAKLSD